MLWGWGVGWGMGVGMNILLIDQLNYELLYTCVCVYKFIYR